MRAGDTPSYARLLQAQKCSRPTPSSRATEPDSVEKGVQRKRHNEHYKPKAEQHRLAAEQGQAEQL